MIGNSHKSRSISNSEMYNLWQLEYITYLIRSRIYIRGMDIARFQDILDGKKEKIESYRQKRESFPHRETLPSIFSCKEKLNQCLNDFYKEGEKPKFQYTPKNMHSHKKWDIHYFYKEDTECTYKGKPAKILKNFAVSGLCNIVCNEEIIQKVKHKDLFVDIKKYFK